MLIFEWLQIVSGKGWKCWEVSWVLGKIALFLDIWEDKTREVLIQCWSEHFFQKHSYEWLQSQIFRLPFLVCSQTLKLLHFWHFELNWYFCCTNQYLLDLLTMGKDILKKFYWITCRRICKSFLLSCLFLEDQDWKLEVCFCWHRILTLTSGKYDDLHVRIPKTSIFSLQSHQEKFHLNQFEVQCTWLQ